MFHTLIAHMERLTLSRSGRMTIPGDEEGQDMVEYALLLGLLTLGVIATVVLIGPYIANTFQFIVNQLGYA